MVRAQVLQYRLEITKWHADIQDTLNLLEKRVKSRFSHRIIRCPPPTTLDKFVDFAKTTLTKPPTVEDVGDLPSGITDDHLDRWGALWRPGIEVSGSFT